MFKQIIFSRSICYGTFPEFEVTVKQDGNVKWLGGMHVKQHGEAEFNLGNDQIIQLNQLLQSFDFRNFEYPSPTISATDLPFCTILVTYQNGAMKEVEHYLGDFAEEGSQAHETFQALEGFENKIEEIIDLENFIGAE
ncbi:DUF6438 domain-containing protein [Gracilibacillus kekensis]|uniref:DUF6438 domain-containing protein n=1 Tax=Gracilibacillus kekensis TaxID=1027249 RepID=A0A1M7P1U6_9BACI|nr:DUF6438 domain-containing protein [Gracilibacillus kekensis]SHN10497.1 hypothetical protein SAMN05216179_1909 [Gracilibacillus kekensis]